MRPPAALVLRPEPGNTATRARLLAAGIEPVALPLFAAHPLAWIPPDPARVDAVLFTSANAPRLGGDGLATLTHLPALAVGKATAAAVRAAGFTVTLTGDRDVAVLLAAASAAGYARPLHLAGREHHPTGTETRLVYATKALPVAPDALADAVARSDMVLLHSPRAARRFAKLVAPGRRSRIAIAGLSPAIAAAAGGGWRAIIHPAAPVDAALVALVRDRLTLPGDGRISGA